MYSLQGGFLLKEHCAAARLGQLEKSAVAEHAWQDGHTIDWSDVRILDEAPKNSVLLIKETLHNPFEVASFPGLHPAFVACSTKSGEGLEYFIT